METDKVLALEEQIKYAEYLCEGESMAVQRAILASLRELAAIKSELAAIKSQPVPVEPERVKAMRSDTWCGGDVSEALRYIDSLQSAQKLAQEELDNQKKRAESLDQELTHCWKQQADAVLALDKAESINRRMLELMKEPSEGMIAAGYPPNDERAQSWDVTEVFKAMSAELLKEADK